MFLFQVMGNLAHFCLLKRDNFSMFCFILAKKYHKLLGYYEAIDKKVFLMYN